MSSTVFARNVDDRTTHPIEDEIFAYCEEIEDKLYFDQLLRERNRKMQ